jgi:hypothetical protein
MIAMTIANFARFDSATACDLKASSHSIAICSMPGRYRSNYIWKTRAALATPLREAHFAASLAKSAEK